jgi:hypothetical protein
MTEAEWLACENLNWLLSIPDERKSARKSRLALCACARSQTFWPLLTSRSSRRVVEVSEAFADGTADKKALHLAQAGASAAVWRVHNRTPAELVSALGYQDSWLLRYGIHYFVNVAARVSISLPARQAQDTHANPFRPAAVSPSCLTPTAVALAHAAYEERALPSGHLDPVRLSILADALEDAGCTDADVVAHLRSPGPHVRGCWAVDLVLGKR